jgi:hypothetical protein
MSGVEEKFVLHRRDQDHVGFDAAPKIFQSRKGGSAVLLGFGKGGLKGMIAGKNRGGRGNLSVALIDQSFENPRAIAQTCFDCSERVLAIGLPDDEIGSALQQSQKRNKKEKQPATEAAEAKFQR